MNKRIILRLVCDVVNLLNSRMVEIAIKASIMSSAKENTLLVHFLLTGAGFPLFEVYDSNIATGKYFSSVLQAFGLQNLAKSSNHPSFHCVPTRSLKKQN